MIITMIITTMPKGNRIAMFDDGSRSDEPRSSDAHYQTSELGLLNLLVWLSPAFPVGAFTYSHGLEWAIEDGTVRDAETLESWLEDVLAHGAGRTDAIVFAATYHAAEVDDEAELFDTLELAAAMQPTRERRLEAIAQGRAFMKAILDTWPTTELEIIDAALAQRLGVAPWTYATAVAVAVAQHGIPLRPALSAMIQAFAMNVVSAGVRAIPLGQTDGLRIVRRLSPVIQEIVDSALIATIDDVGGAAFRADIASMKHETQYTRLFRS